MSKRKICVTISEEVLEKFDMYAAAHSVTRSLAFEQMVNMLSSIAGKPYSEEYSKEPGGYSAGGQLESLVKKYSEEYSRLMIEEYSSKQLPDLVREYCREYSVSQSNGNTFYSQTHPHKESVKEYSKSQSDGNTFYSQPHSHGESTEEYSTSQSNGNTVYSTQVTNSKTDEPDYVNDPDAWPINQNCERGYIMPRMPLTWDEYKTDSDWYFASDYWWQNEPSAHPFMSQTLDAQQSAAECCGYLVWGPKGPHKPFNQIELQMLKFAETKPEIQERCFAATGWRPAEPEKHIPQTLQHIELPEIEETPLTREQEELMDRIKKVAEKKNCGMFEAWDLQRENEFFIPEEWELMEKKYMQDTTPLNLFVNIAVKDHLLANEPMCRDLIKFLREKYPLCESWKMLEARAEEGSFTISDLCEELVRCGDSVNPLPEISF